MVQLNSTSSQQKALRGLKHQIDTLAQFIIRISKFYEGVSPQLDKELQQLRSHLGGKANFTLADVSIRKLTGLLMENADHLRAHTAKTQSMLESAVKALQQDNGLPSPLKEDIQGFLLTLKEGQPNINSSLSHFEAALALYQKALANKPQGQGAKSSSNNQPTGSEVAELHQEICNELRELVTQLSPTDDNGDHLKSIKEKLVRGLSHRELLECCLVLVRAILKDLVKERKHAERFISSLYKTLSTVSSNVGKSIEDSQEKYQLKIQTSSAMREQMADMAQAIGKANDLSQLKQQAVDYLARIAQTLDSRDSVDKEEQMMLMSLLQDMKDQLSQLEQDTADYRHRLLQQRYHSHHDPLTQIPNRNAYNDRVDMEYRRWRRHGTDLCLALVDIDRFKDINDNYGHAGGDKTLQVIAQQISKCLRSTDFLARWGGEEFVILLPQTPVDELEKPLQHIRQQIENIPFKFKDISVTITVSIGASNFCAGDSIESVFDRADRALYQAKREGRNRCIVERGVS
ncbi:diguanylate cyclase [Aliiglaciecola sp. CAU 1673]|uniref:GGDEF domain-containing protein n=1 Tax=Aliiglaciecola sp. CAU 1673 TaxID=3032595 RepID=UPI0023DA8CCE|nr:GGDEF domain-containing protein [Aliiglaciecola sp. CAU 1673]MDF2179641.1 diguanylate cyclase [Aliiglaciecola sp. CAU 1673]